MSFVRESVNAAAADEPVKQRLSDTFLTFLPKNTSGYTYVNQLIDIQIPKTEHIINLAKAYVNVKLQIPLKLDAAYAAPDDGSRCFVGLLNSATMFDQVQIHSNNKVILSDTFSQINSRIWHMSKATNWLNANYFSFINIDDITYNEGFIVHELTAARFNDANYKKVYYNMKIPLPCIFNCFDNCEAFSTTQLNDNVTLTMQLSSPEKYLCLFITDKNGKITKVVPFDETGKCKYNGNHTVEYSSQETVTGYEDTAYKIEEGFKIICPGHYPTEEDKIDINNVIANGGWFREFTTTWVQAQDASFGPSSTGFTTQTSLNFNTNVSNLYGIIMLAAHNHTYTVFDKPYISDIEMNASEIWKLANGHTHTDATYDGDNDMYIDLCNVFGQQTFKNLERFDKAIARDYRYKGEKLDLYRTVTATLVLDLNEENTIITGLNSFNITTGNITSDGTAVNTTYAHDDTAHTRTITITWKAPVNAINTFTNNAYTVEMRNDTADDATITTAITYSDVNGQTTATITTGATSATITFTLSSKNENTHIQKDNMLGSYMQYYRFAPSNQLGYSGDYFSNQINYKYKSLYKELTYDGSTKNMTQNNYDNSTMFCCCQTLSFLVFKEGGLDIINPFSEDIDVRVKFSGQYNSYCGNGHGIAAIIPGLIKPVTDLISGGVGGLRRLIKENRHHHNETYAYSQLGKDGYEKNRDIIESHSTMRKRKFKKFINGLKQMEQQMNNHGLIVAHGVVNQFALEKGATRDMSKEPEEIAEPATFDELNLQPFVQSYSADLADCEYKNQLILDYKFRLNCEKIRLASFGSEAAMNANNYHGRVGDWFRKIGHKIKGWFKKDGKRILKNVGENLLGVAKEYAAKIATGEMSLSDIKGLKPELKEKIKELVQKSTSGTSLEGITGDAMNWYRKWKNGELKWSDIPRDMIGRIKELDLKEKSGKDHGLIIRHGFVEGARIRPTELYTVQKQRIKHLMGKNPMELRRKDLRKMYRFRYLKENPPIDTSHGRLAELMRQRYPPAVVAPKPLIGGDAGIWKAKWKKSKSKLIQSEHGIGYLNKLKEKAAHKGIINPDRLYMWKHKKAKKFLRKWSDRLREQQNTAAKETAEPEHGIGDYNKMREIWKKYKSQYKPK